MTTRDSQTIPLDAASAWRTLSETLNDTAPGCANDPRFTTDRLPASDLADMQRICAECLALAACNGYAVAAEHASTRSKYAAKLVGFWAGKRRGNQILECAA